MQTNFGSLLVAMSIAVAGCAGEPAHVPEAERAAENATLDNGFTLNGLITNGIITNGLITNGLITNGLITNGIITNGLQTEEFHAWFEHDADFSDMVMRYVVRCAVPAGESRSYVSESGSRNWEGSLGLAPQWSAGAPIPVAEQQLVSACLAAHANKTGTVVTVSLRGYHASGEPIATTSAERDEYRQVEGCFFGNLFSGDGVHAGFDRRSPLARKGNCSPRVCAANDGSAGDCPPIVAAGMCQRLCRGTGAEIRVCESAGGHEFLPVMTYLRDEDIFPCAQ